jgi:hypothetical protein
MSFHGSPGHFQLTCNFGVVTALQKQLDDLLFAWAQPNSLFLHRSPLFFGIAPPTPRKSAALNVSNSIASTLPYSVGNRL